MVQLADGVAPVVHTVELLDWATGGPAPRALTPPAGALMARLPPPSEHQLKDLPKRRILLSNAHVALAAPARPVLAQSAHRAPREGAGRGAGSRGALAAGGSAGGAESGGRGAGAARRAARVCDSWAICEYLEETRPERRLLALDPVERAEVRRLVAWFDVKFMREVTDLIWREKVLKFAANRDLELRGGPGRCRQPARTPGLHRVPVRTAQLARGRPHQPGRCAAGAQLGARLSRRRALGDTSGHQAVLRPAEVAPELPAAARRPRALPQARRPLRRPGFLSRRHS